MTWQDEGSIDPPKPKLERPRLDGMAKALRGLAKILDRLTPDEQRRMVRCLYTLYEGEKQ